MISQENKIQEAKDPANTVSRLQTLLAALKEKRLLTLVVEPISKCNLTCNFCDLHSGRIPDVEQYKGQMGIDIWSKLMHQLKDLGYKLKQLQIHGNGEPLLHKKIVEFISIAHQMEVAESIKITTNGTLLTPAILAKVINAGVDEIRVSVDAGEPELWENFKGKKLYKKLERNLYNAIDYVAMHPHVKLTLKYPTVSKDQDLSYGVTESFKNSVLQSFSGRIKSPNVILSSMPVFTMMDGVIQLRKKNPTPCEIPFYSLFVKFDGRVSVCCADITNLLDLGSINVEGLHSIIHGRALSEFRLKHLDGRFEEIPICLYCFNRTCVDLAPVAQSIRSLI